MKTKLETKLETLLRDYGYRFAGGQLIERGIRGFTSDRILPYRFRSIFAAAEHLIPIVACDEFSKRLRAA